MIRALRSVFDSGYNRDRQFIDLKITNDFPLKQEDYPCLVIEYTPQRNINAGIAHEEWFMDERGVLRRWGHRRFEGSLTLNILALTPLDRDLLADAVEEVITLGYLDTALQSFLYTIYGQPTDPVMLVFSQLMLNTDEVSGGGNSASLAPWNPEDQLVHETTLELVIHGGIYNTVPSETWNYVTRATAQSYPQFEETVVLPFGDPDIPWTNPFEFEDDAVAGGSAVISASES